jgi:hypothetical protein
MFIILTTWEAEFGRIIVQDQSKQKVCKTPISTIGWARWHMPFISSSRGSTNRRIAVQGSWDPLSKIINKKRAGEVVQMVEPLPSKARSWVWTLPSTVLPEESVVWKIKYLDQGPLLVQDGGRIWSSGLPDYLFQASQLHSWSCQNLSIAILPEYVLLYVNLLIYFHNLNSSFFFVGLGFNSELYAWKAGALLLESCLKSIFPLLFWRWSLENCFPGLASNYNPPSLSLPNS